MKLDRHPIEELIQDGLNAEEICAFMAEIPNNCFVPAHCIFHDRENTWATPCEHYLKSLRRLIDLRARQERSE